MIKWIARWFNQSPATQAAVATQSDIPADIEPAPQAGDVHTLFYRWLAGPPGDDVQPSTEKLIIDEFTRLVEAPQSAADLVPRVPAVIPQLLRSLRDDSISGAELSRQLAQDVVLVAEVIREANSPWYRPSAPVKTIEGAIMLLGQNGMRMLLARVAFRPIISNQSGHFALQVAPHVWRQSETCALAASMLAPAMRANPFEAYLAGLLHHVGLIVAFRLIDQIYTGAALPQSDQFCAALLSNASVLSARIAALWEFPVTVSIAIEQAGVPGAPPLAQVLALADRVAMLRMLVDAGRLAAGDPSVLHGLGPAAAACFVKLSHEED
jgi:HD-like signal output (HDOD) protein